MRNILLALTLVCLGASHASAEFFSSRVGDTNLVNKYLALADKTRNEDSIRMYGQQALGAAKKIKWDKGIVKSYMQLTRTNEKDFALNCLLNARQICENNKYYLELLTIYQWLGNYIYEEDAANRMKYALLALGVARQTRNEKKVAHLQSAISAHYKEAGKLDMARRYADSALEKAKKLNDTLLIVSVLNDIGNLYDVKNNSTDAKNYYTEALEIVKKLNDDTWLANQYTSMAFDLGRYDIEDKVSSACAPMLSENRRLRTVEQRYQAYWRGLCRGTQI